MSGVQPPTNQPARDPAGNLMDARTTPVVPTPVTPQTPGSTEKTDDTDTSLLNAKEPEGEKKPEAEGEKKPVEAKAPDAYADFKAPEGFEIDKDAVAKVAPIFKELGLNQEGAQKLVSAYAEISQAAANSLMESSANKQKEWATQIKSDPEIGGNKLAQTKATISQALDSILSKADAKAFREAMDYTGAGNHPAFARGLFKLASLLTEAPSRDHVNGNGPTKEGTRAPGTSERPSTAKAIYPNLP